MRRLLCAFTALLLLAACSPALNWRTVALADARWFARLEGNGVRVYQVMVLSPGQPVAGAERDTFVQGLQLR